MNFANLWNLLRFAWSKTPATAMAVLNALRPDEWDMQIGETPVTSYKPRFSVVESYRTKRLVVEIDYVLNGVKHRLKATTKFKNDGSDELWIDDTQMECIDKQIFDFDAIPGRREVRIEMRFLDGALPRDISLFNQL